MTILKIKAHTQNQHTLIRRIIIVNLMLYNNQMKYMNLQKNNKQTIHLRLNRLKKLISLWAITKLKVKLSKAVIS
jgi:hypothetical protein